MAAITSLQGNRQIGAVDNIRQNLSADQARNDFGALRTLVGRNATSSVQVKLVNTTNANQLMQFQTKGWWGRTFSHSEKLVNTNAAILEIVKKTGLPETSSSFRNLKDYLDQKTTQQRAGSARGLTGLLDAIHQDLGRKPALGAATADSVAKSLTQQGYAFEGLDTQRFIASGGHGRIYGEQAGKAKGVLYKELRELFGDSALPRLKVKQDADGRYQMDRNATELAAVSLRHAKVPHAASPIAYVIKDTWDDEFHAVSVDHMKQWTAEHGEQVAEDGDRFRIVGQVLPKAEGGSLGAGTRLAPEDRKAIARQALESLKAMSEHGYVHGDIKPDNLMYSADKKQLTLIDFGGLTKQSKHGDSGNALGNPLSPAYVIPSSHHASGANNTGGYGYEADLYAMGLSMLESFLPHAQALGDLGTREYLDRDEVAEILDKLRANPALITPGGPEELAVKMMSLALEHETPLTGRLGPANPRLEAVWQEIMDHPAAR